MYNTTPYTPVYTVFQYGGHRYNYDNIVDLVKDFWVVRGVRRPVVYDCKYRIAPDFQPYCNRCRQPLKNHDINNKCEQHTYTYNKATKKAEVSRHTYDNHDIFFCIIIRDDFGTTYTEKEIVDLYKKQRVRLPHRTNFWIQHDHSWSIRNHNMKQRFGSGLVVGFYRSLQFANEMRQYEASQVGDITPRIRAKRNLTNLPNSWDDHRNTLCEQSKNWKTQRVRKQWMVNSDNQCKRRSVVNHQITDVSDTDSSST